MDDPATECGALFEATVFLSHFNDLPDPRQAVKVVYPLDEVLLLSLLAVLAGAEAFTDIARFGDKKLELLRRFRLFVDGTPPHDRIPATALPPRPGDRVPGRPGTSRFSCRWFPATHGVSDRAGPACTTPWRCPPCCFPLFSKASAPWSFNFSRLNTQLASAPVNASPAAAR